MGSLNWSNLLGSLVCTSSLKSVHPKGHGQKDTDQTLISRTQSEQRSSRNPENADTKGLWVDLSVCLCSTDPFMLPHNSINAQRLLNGSEGFSHLSLPIFPPVIPEAQLQISEMLFSCTSWAIVHGKHTGKRVSVNVRLSVANTTGAPFPTRCTCSIPGQS